MTVFTPGTTLASTKAIVIDTTAPVLTPVTPIASPLASLSGIYYFSATESGTYAITNCGYDATTTINPGASVVLSNLRSGNIYTCTFNVTDLAGNVSNTLTIGPVTVFTRGAVSLPILQVMNTVQQVAQPTPTAVVTTPTSVVTQPVSAPASTAFSFQIDMKQGSSISDVRRLQAFLKSMGPTIYPANIPVKGYLGPATYH